MSAQEVTGSTATLGDYVETCPGEPVRRGRHQFNPPPPCCEKLSPRRAKRDDRARVRVCYPPPPRRVGQRRSGGIPSRPPFPQGEHPREMLGASGTPQQASARSTSTPRHDPTCASGRDAALRHRTLVSLIFFRTEPGVGPAGPVKTLRKTSHAPASLLGAISLPRATDVPCGAQTERLKRELCGRSSRSPIESCKESPPRIGGRPHPDMSTSSAVPSHGEVTRQDSWLCRVLRGGRNTTAAPTRVAGVTATTWSTRSSPAQAPKRSATARGILTRDARLVGWCHGGTSTLARRALVADERGSGTGSPGEAARGGTVCLLTCPRAHRPRRPWCRPASAPSARSTPCGSSRRTWGRRWGRTPIRGRRPTRAHKGKQDTQQGIGVIREPRGIPACASYCCGGRSPRLPVFTGNPHVYTMTMASCGQGRTERTPHARGLFRIRHSSVWASAWRVPALPRKSEAIGSPEEHHLRQGNLRTTCAS